MLSRIVLALPLLVSSLALSERASAQELYIYIMMTGDENDLNGGGGTIPTPIAAGHGQMVPLGTSTGLVYARTTGLPSGGPLVRYGATANNLATWSPSSNNQCGSVTFGPSWWITGIEYEVVSQVNNGGVWSDVIQTHDDRFAEVNHHCIFDVAINDAPPGNVAWAGPELTDFSLPQGYGIDVSNGEFGPMLNQYHWWNPSNPTVNAGMPVTAATPQLFLRVCMTITNVDPGQDVQFHWITASNVTLNNTPPAATQPFEILTVLGAPPSNFTSYTMVALAAHVHDHCEATWLEHYDPTYMNPDGTFGAWLPTIPLETPKNILSTRSTHQLPDYMGMAAGNAGTWHAHRYNEFITMYGANLGPTNPGHLSVKGMTYYYPTGLVHPAATPYRQTGTFYNPHSTPANGQIDNMMFYSTYWF